MFKTRNIGLLALSFILGYGIFYLLGGHILAAIFAVLWFDKVLIGVSGIVHKFGIEFTTIATILMGLIYGPIIAFVMSIIILPVLYGIRYVLLPIAPPEWPLFVPSPQNLVEAIGAAVAGLLVGFPLLTIFLAVFVIKEVAYVIADRLIGKPPDIIYPVVNFVFNLLIVFYLGGFFLGLVGL